MHGSHRHGARKVVAALAAAALAAVLCTSALATSRPPARSKVTIAGTWKGTYSGPYSGSFTLTWKQVRSKLTGSIKLSSPPGSYPISGSVHHGAITFGVVGAGATYTGTWSGKSMSGRYHTGAGNGSWSAHKLTRVTR